MPIFRIAENVTFNVGKTSAFCCSSHELGLSEASRPHHLISWLHGACAGQELQKEIKKLEEEVVERAWRCGCHIIASMPGGRDVVEPCSNLMQMGV